MMGGRGVIFPGSYRVSCFVHPFVQEIMGHHSGRAGYTQCFGIGLAQLQLLRGLGMTTEFQGHLKLVKGLAIFAIHQTGAQLPSRDWFQTINRNIWAGPKVTDECLQQPLLLKGGAFVRGNTSQQTPGHRLHEGWRNDQGHERSPECRSS